MPRLSIIIVTYNSRGEIDACLRSLMEGAGPSTALGPSPSTTLGTSPSTALGTSREIVVVDNASTDGTATHLRERWPGVRLIEAGANIGFARATNIGIRQTSGELVLLLNPDTSVPHGAIDGLVSALERNPDAAAAGPRIVDARGRAELSFGRMISPLVELWQKPLMVGNQRQLPVLRSIAGRLTRRTRHVDWVSGACLLTYRADLEAVGLLDERFFLYMEDVDLCASMRRRGRRVLFVAEVEVTHRRGASATPAEQKVAYRHSYVAFYEKHHPGWMPLVKAYLGVFSSRR